ncbi:MAG: molecular chaperone DnaK, partial [Pseudomonas sp.]|nr:molecular chaperone DnaK [Pseudomonas sp.]
AIKGDDKEAIEAKMNALSEATTPLAQKMYAEQPQAADAAAPGAEAAAGADDVVDAEFEEVKEPK